MTHPPTPEFACRNLGVGRTALPKPDANNWFVYRAGDEIRCPGPSHARSRLDGFCGKYMGTVSVGITRVRVEQPLTGTDRRQHPRYTDTCHRNTNGCGSKLEVEMLTEAAA